MNMFSGLKGRAVPPHQRRPPPLPPTLYTRCRSCDGIKTHHCINPFLGCYCGR